jgi:cysteine desulfurase / selenocysteine lyase
MADLDTARIRRDFPLLARRMNGHPLVYLDNAATSQKPRAMIDRMVEVYSRDYAHPEEGHGLSREATAAFEESRQKVARLINAADAREVVFCRGATEAINLIGFSYGHGLLAQGDEVLVSQAEHHSNIVPWLLATRQVGARVVAAPVDANGDIDIAALERLLTERTKLVAVTHASNVTGGIQLVERISRLARERGIPILVDGAQAVPHIPVDVQAIGCDFYAGSGHKMGGPSSVGFLWGRRERLSEIPLADGGSTMAKRVTFEDVEAKRLPHRFEAGEPAFAEVTAWAAAIDYWTGLGLDRIAACERDLTSHLVDGLSAIDGVRVLGRPRDRISVTSFVVEGRTVHEVDEELDHAGIAVRAGSLEAQPFLAALGVEEAIRASVAFYNTEHEVDLLVRAVDRAVPRKSRRSTPKRVGATRPRRAVAAARSSCRRRFPACWSGGTSTRSDTCPAT